MCIVARTGIKQFCKVTGPELTEQKTSKIRRISKNRVDSFTKFTLLTLRCPGFYTFKCPGGKIAPHNHACRFYGTYEKNFNSYTQSQILKKFGQRGSVC